MAEAQRGSRGRLHIAGRRAAYVALAAVLAGCGAAPTPKPSPTATPTPTPSATATSTPTPSPSPSPSAAAHALDPAIALQIDPPYELDQLDPALLAREQPVLDALPPILAAEAGSGYTAADFPIGIRTITSDTSTIADILVLGLPPLIATAGGALATITRGMTIQSGATVTTQTVHGIAVDIVAAAKPTAVTILGDDVLLIEPTGSTPNILSLATAVVKANDSLSVMSALIPAAQAEGNLTVIALPHDWCDYGELLTGFTRTFGITINELQPEASSQDELDAVTATKGETGSTVPDVLDIGSSLAQNPSTSGLLQPYEVAPWASIPAVDKDPAGYWYGDYSGVIAFEVNTAKVKHIPQDWSDLLKPEYKGMIALSGDPTDSNQAIYAIWAAALAAHGSLDNPQAGLDFFKTLNAKGNLIPRVASAADVASGAAPIRITWTLLAVPDQEFYGSQPRFAVVVPRTGRLGSLYAQAISAYAPHPNAARLWMEYLYSVAGQNAWLRGACYPVLYATMARNGTLDAAANKAMPNATGFQVPTRDQVIADENIISTNWLTTVGVAIQ